MTVNAHAQVSWNGDTADFAELSDRTAESATGASASAPDLSDQATADQLDAGSGS